MRVEWKERDTNVCSENINRSMYRECPLVFSPRQEPRVGEGRRGVSERKVTGPTREEELIGHLWLGRKFPVESTRTEKLRNRNRNGATFVSEGGESLGSRKQKEQITRRIWSYIYLRVVQGPCFFPVPLSSYRMSGFWT